MSRSAEPNPDRDWSNKPGAEALAAEIRQFWKTFAGQDVLVWVEVGCGGKQPVWVIKSNLRAGLPPSGCGSNPLAAAGTRCGS